MNSQMNDDGDELMLLQNREQSSNEFDVPEHTTVLANPNYNQYQEDQLHLFMREDEMTSWLHYPFPDTAFCSKFSHDLLYPSSSAGTVMTKSETAVTPSSAAVISQKPCGVDKSKGKEKVLQSHSKLESFETKKTAKRSRSAEVHNQSERRRRDRINQKLRALRELLPCSGKLDKASVLEYAVEYLKSLQMQVQMMSMAYNVVPVVFPGMQLLVPPLLMGTGRPVSPLSDVFTGASLPDVTTTVGPRFAMWPYQIPVITYPDSSTTQSPHVSMC